MRLYIFVAMGFLLACNSRARESASAPEVPPAALSTTQAAPMEDAAQEPKLAHALRVATFNINFGNVNLPSITRTIAETDADFVFLQETNKQSQAHFLKELKTQYPHAQFSDSSRRWSAGGFGFLSKIPFEKPQFLPAKHGLFGTYITEVKLGDKDIRMINLHLSPIRVGRARTMADVFSALHTMEEVHAEEAALLIDMFNSENATIVAGDLNSISSQVAPRVLVEKGLIDAIAATVEGADTKRTWQWPINGKDIGFRIDYIFHTSHFHASGGEIVRSEASDHEIVLADLAWK